ncbi:MAG: DNA repair protein RecO [bacterium]
MSIKNTEALVIGSVNLIEADRIITFYTRGFGKIKAVAKGVKSHKSRFGSRMELLTHCNIIYTEKEGRELHYIRKAETIDSHEGFRHDMKKLTAALYIAELVENLIKEGEEGEYEVIFFFLLKVLQCLRDYSDIDSILRIYEIRMLHFLGFMPELHRCVMCKHLFNNGRWFFSVSAGGLVCTRCRSTLNENIPISHGGVMFLRKAVSINRDKIERLHLLPSTKGEINYILHKYIVYRIEKELKSYPFLGY